MLGSHHFVHPVMRLDAEAVRTRMNSGASPHHRIVSAKSENTVPLRPQSRLGPAGDGRGIGSGHHGEESSPVAHHHFLSRALENDPVMW
jgi:hypothetical protein